MKELQFSPEGISSPNWSSISSCKIAPLVLTETRSHAPSFGTSLSYAERLHYYRLCYLSLGEKEISQKLRGDIEDGLGTDAEKELFYARYRMLDELLTLYLRLSEYRKAVGTLEEKGDPDKAWEAITEHIEFFLPQQPLDHEARIRNYARARDFLAILGTFPGDVFLSSTTGPGARDPWPLYEGAGKFWDNLALTVNKIFTHPISYDSIDLPEKWMNQFLDITVGAPSRSLPSIELTFARHR